MAEDSNVNINMHQYYFDIEDYHMDPHYESSTIDGSDSLTVSLPVVQKDSAGFSRLKLIKSQQVLEFEARQDFNGRVNIDFTVCDSAGLCRDMSLTIVITPVNDSP